MVLSNVCAVCVLGFPSGASDKEPACQCRRRLDPCIHPENPWATILRVRERMDSESEHHFTRRGG